MVLNALVPVVLMANGMGAGVLMGTQLGGWPLLESLPPSRYVRTHVFLATRYDPFMPIALVGTAVGDAVLAAVAGGLIPAALFLVAGALALATVVVSLTVNVPVNRWIRTLDPQALPADFATLDPREHWGRWNRVRTVFTVSGLAANCIAVGLLL